MSNINGRTVTTPLNPNKFVPSGFGYGEPMHWLGYNGGITETFQEDLEAAFASLPNGTSMQVRFYDKNLNSELHAGTLYRIADHRGFLTSDNYSGVKAIKPYCNYKWGDWETENQTLEANKAYRTTERINGKAVYKISDSLGNVMYRLDGDTEWRSYHDLIGANTSKDLVGDIVTNGVIVYGTGVEKTDSADLNERYGFSDYIPVRTDDILKYNNLYCPSSYCVVAIYDSNKVYLDGVRGKTPQDPVPGADGPGQKKIKQDGYIRVGTKWSRTGEAMLELITRAEGKIVLRKTLNILVIGNSFSQDSFAYLPPVLNEILPDYAINYGVAYESGCSIEKHYKMLTDPDSLYDAKDNPKPAYYDRFNSWNVGEAKWTRSSPINSITLTDIMAMRKWDIIYVQPEGAASKVSDRVITPGRKFLRELQKLNGGPFSFMMGQWLATRSDVTDTTDFGQTVYKSLCNAMQTVKQQVGIVDYIPIGTAFQFARTNSTFRDLGIVDKKNNFGNMIYDTSYDKDDANKQEGGHMQAGLPALLATYTVALKILECIGESHRGIYGSSFVPTRDVCVAIGAYKDEGMVSPLPMTHGEPQGVTAANIRAAQEIAVLAVNNPTAYPPIDCSGIIV